MADGPEANDIDPLETREWLESIDAVLKVHGPVRAHFLLDRLIDHARRSGTWLPFKAEHGLRQHDPRLAREALSGRSRARAAHRVADPLECGRDGGACEPGEHRIRRPHRDLRLVGDALRGRLQSFLARALRAPSRRHGLRPGSFEPGHLRARLPRGPPDGRAAAALPPGSRRQGALVVPAPLADAGFLAVPDGLDGPRPAAGDHAGPLRALPRAPRPGRGRATRRSGASSATARWTSRSRWAH